MSTLTSSSANPHASKASHRDGPVALTEDVLGVPFFTGTLAEACEAAACGGLVVAPSAPGLSTELVCDPAYRAALQEADLVLTDSGFMVWLWWIRSGRHLRRTSGLAFLRAFLEGPARPSVSWIMPDAAAAERNRAWLETAGWPTTDGDCCVAPRYGAGPITDEPLRQRLEARRPDVIILAVGGGVQERIGHYLQTTLSYRPRIYCLGAAIAFLSGAQVGIPRWVDRARLGWLWRVCSNPVEYAPRYFRALRLAWLVLRHGRRLPPGLKT